MKKNKLWWFWATRNINSDLNLIGFTNAETGPAQIARTTLQNQTAKLSYQINSKNTLSYTMQWDKKYQPHLVTAANAAFVNTTLCLFKTIRNGFSRWCSIRQYRRDQA